jgi:hypothetical protein
MKTEGRPDAPQSRVNAVRARFMIAIAIILLAFVLAVVFKWPAVVCSEGGVTHGTSTGSCPQPSHLGDQLLIAGMGVAAGGLIIAIGYVRDRQRHRRGQGPS